MYIMTTPKRHSPSKLIRDISIIITSIVVAYFLVEVKAFEGFLAALSGIKFLGSFVVCTTASEEKKLRLCTFYLRTPHWYKRQRHTKLPQ